MRTLDLLDPDLYVTVPTDTYAYLRDEAPAYPMAWPALDLEPRRMWAISRHADVLGVERDWHTWSSAWGTRPGMTDQITTPSMIDSDNPRHAHQRFIVQHAFTRRSVAEREAEIRARVTRLIDRVATRGRCDFVADVAIPLPLGTICDLLGFPEDKQPTLEGWATLVSDLGDGYRTHRPDKLAALDEWRAYAMAALAERRAHPAGDLMSTLAGADAYDGCHYDMERLVSETLLILVGGYETTRSTIAEALIQFSAHPEQWALLVREPERMAVAVEELIRFTTPVLNMTRVATRDAAIADTPIARGDKVLLLYGAANRDPSVFAEPDRFDVTRSPNPHLAFGFGPHLCIGANLARAEIRILFEELASRLPDIHVPADVVPAWERSAFVRSIHTLPAEFTPTR